MNDTLIAIATIFSQLSLLAFGGGNTILPEMQRQVVDVHHWMSAHEFTALLRWLAAPGPNMMIVSLVGWHVAGWAAVASLAKFGPSSIVTVLALHAWERFRDRLRRYVQQGMMPVTAGRRGQRGADLRASNRTAIQWASRPRARCSRGARASIRCGCSRAAR